MMALKMRKQGQIVKEEAMEEWDWVGQLWGEYQKKEIKDNFKVLNLVWRMPEIEGWMSQSSHYGDSVFIQDWGEGTVLFSP